jgi:transcriptional regulator with XRE-family HTH domain
LDFTAQNRSINAYLQAIKVYYLVRPLPRVAYFYSGGEMGNIHEILGKRIQSFRKKRGLTQLQLAEMANLSLEHLGAIERGRGNPTLESLHNLCVAFDISLKMLFDIEIDTLTAEDVERIAIEIIHSSSSTEKSKFVRILKILAE